MASSLNGKVAIITSGARGIGLSTATALARKGARVAIGDIDQTTLSEAASVSKAAFHDRLDVTDYRSFVDKVEAALEKPRPRVLVPRYTGAIVGSQSLVPRRVGEFLTDTLGGDTAFLDDVGQSSRAGYEARATHS